MNDQPPRIGGHEALTRKTLRQAIRALTAALDDPRYDDWDDDMILSILGEIITRHRKQRDETIFINLSGAQVLPEEQINRFVQQLSNRLRRDQ